MLVQVAGTQGTVRLDDFVVPYLEDKNAFLVTGNHGFGKLDTCVTTETEEHIVSSDEDHLHVFGMALGC